MCGSDGVVLSWSLLIRGAQRARRQAEIPLIVLCRFPGPALFVVAKDHVHDPVQGVLDGPVRADHWTDRVGQHHQRGDVEARLVGDLAVDFAPAFYHDDGVQARPLVACLQPDSLVDHDVVSRLDTAVIGIDRLVRADRCILEFQGFLFIDEDVDILAQGSLSRICFKLRRIKLRGNVCHGVVSCPALQRRMIRG